MLRLVTATENYENYINAHLKLGVMITNYEEYDKQILLLVTATEIYENYNSAHLRLRCNN